MTSKPDLGSRLEDLLTPLPPLRGLPEGLVRRARRRRAFTAASAAGGAALVAFGVIALAPVRSHEPGSLATTPQPTPSAAPTAPAPTPSASPAPLRLVLQPGGFGYTRGEAGTGRVEFGASRAAVTDVLTRALGPGTTSPLPDCGAHIVIESHAGLSAYFDGTRWVGWSLGAVTPALRTGDGVGVGSTLAALRASIAGVRVTTGSLGVEWVAPGDAALSGGLDGTSAASRVTRIAAGVTCQFR